MSRGPGRLQRAILDTMAGHEHEPDIQAALNHHAEAIGRMFGPAQPRRRPQQQPGEWTTSDVCSALSGAWWWDPHFDRQVRRALERLARTGAVEKRTVPNLPHYPHATRAFWKLHPMEDTSGGDESGAGETPTTGVVKVPPVRD